MGKVNVNGKDIPGYEKLLNKRNKMILDRLFIESSDFDIPAIVKTNKNGYCDAANCFVSEHPSKFPYPYTIKQDDLLIRFQGNIYHPKCYQASGKCDTAAKDMKNYQNLTDEEKQTFDGILKKAEKRKCETDYSNNSSKENEEPSTKKKKLSADEDDEGAAEKDNLI